MTPRKRDGRSGREPTARASNAFAPGGGQAVGGESLNWSCPEDLTKGAWFAEAGPADVERATLRWTASWVVEAWIVSCVCPFAPLGREDCVTVPWALVLLRRGPFAAFNVPGAGIAAAARRASCVAPAPHVSTSSVGRSSRRSSACG